MRRIVMVCSVGLLLSLALPGGAAAVEKWGPFRGQVVDVETGQPIAGAAVLVIWWKGILNPVQGAEKFYDAREAVSDAEGRFEVPRLRPPFFRLGILPPRLTYFAPGYKPVAEVVTPPDGELFVAPTVVQMQRLKTREERRNANWHLPPGGVPHEKMPNLLRALNRELSGKETEPYSLGGNK